MGFTIASFSAAPFTYETMVGKPEGNRTHEDFGVHWKIISGRVLGKQDGKFWTGLVCQF
jgi:hypothetical protein